MNVQVLIKKKTVPSIFISFAILFQETICRTIRREGSRDEQGGGRVLRVQAQARGCQ